MNPPSLGTNVPNKQLMANYGKPIERRESSEKTEQDTVVRKMQSSQEHDFFLHPQNEEEKKE